ncbi:hypothetical protein [Nonomuraea endophytica]|uniref:hypothetical protein n=1 Tax=Nonomuraea endophytica TaxID=714136 RepID=UPI0037C73DD1
MIWLYIVGAASLGFGWVAAGMRRKDKKPKKKLAVLAVGLLLLFSVSMFFTPLGGICVNVGAWMITTATAGGVSTLFGTVVVFCTVAAACLLLAGVLRDVAKDGIPDPPTFVACISLWVFAGLATGVIWGPTQYDRFTAEVMRATVESWQR